MHTSRESSDLLVFSHLRWDFVFQRPQHLLLRQAKHRRVFYFEEPVFGITDTPRLHLRQTSEGVQVVTPYLASNLKPDEREVSLRNLVDEVILEEEIVDYTIWYYTPTAFSFSRHLEPAIIIYDCMEELSLPKGIPASLIEKEAELILKADLVFTAGHSLYEAKKASHPNIHSFPNSIDYGHFSQGRLNLIEPEDQINIPHPRLGFYGIIDNRLDITLLEKMADLKPDFHFIIIGPVLKIDPASLPKRPNIHYLGKKDYHTLPLYLAGWDCTIMPFAINESTRFISPTKTPEFLAAGKPVVSTAISDVIRLYEKEKLVSIAHSTEEFVNLVEITIRDRGTDPEWIQRVDKFLSTNSWDITFEKMSLLESEVKAKKSTSHKKSHYSNESASEMNA